MKSIKLLLAVFAFSAIFTACTKEEMTPVQEYQNDEFVGADLVGTNVSLNFGTDSDSKVTAAGDWETSDKLGLGWVVKTGYATAQTGATPDIPEIYGNHMFQIENGKFTTRGNIYQGWHFAYFPFKHMPQLGKVLDGITINPTQENKDFNVDYRNTALYLSPRQFISAEKNIDKATYQIKDLEDFDLLKVAKTIGFTVKPSSTFTESDVLSSLTIKSINITAKEKAFYGGNVTLNPALLGKAEYTDGVFDKAKTNKLTYESFVNVINGTNVKKAPSYTNTITTLIDNEDINLSGEQTLRIHTLPKEITLTKKDIVITIAVQCGYFEVKYIADDEDPRYNETNNAAIETIVEAYAEDGYMSAYNSKTGLKLTLELTSALFTEDFGAISSEAEWDKAVALADDLDLEETTFNIVNTPATTPFAWSFTEVKDGELISLPDAELTVTGNPIKIGASGVWPDTDKLTVNTGVVVNAALQVEGELNATSIDNNSTIYAGPEASISNKTAKVLDNTDGRVIVKYGAYVYAAGGKEGTIAYVVDNAQPANIVRINTLTSGDNKLGNAFVNTLIVKDTQLDLNAQAVAGLPNDDRYNSTATSDKFLVSLANVNIELENGALVHYLAGENTTVANVLASSGENTIDDIDVEGKIATKAGAVLNVNNTVVTAIAKPYFSEEIANNGTLNSNVATLTVVRTDNAKGNINVADNCCIYYADEYVQGGSVKGWILKSAAPSAPEKATEEDLEFDGASTYTVHTALGLLKLSTIDIAGKTVVLDDNIDMAGIEWAGLKVLSNAAVTFNGNGKTITNLTGSQGLLGRYVIADVTNLKLKDVTIYSDQKMVGALAGQLYGNLNNVDVDGAYIAGNGKEDNGEAGADQYGSEKYGAIIGLYSAGNATGCDVEDAVITGVFKHAGAIAGCINQDGGPARVFTGCTVDNCNISAGKQFGAIVGYAYCNLTLDSCEVENTNPSAFVGGKAAGVVVTINE